MEGNSRAVELELLQQIRQQKAQLLDEIEVTILQSRVSPPSPTHTHTHTPTSLLEVVRLFLLNVLPSPTLEAARV